MSSSSVGNQPRLVGRGPFDRALYLARIRRVEDWPDHTTSPEPQFGVLLVMDASRVPGDTIARLAKTLMDQGMVYLCAWGPDCSRVHDICDLERVRRGETDDAFVSTTSHDDEDLDDALWFAVMEMPADAYIETCRAVVAIVVDQHDWSNRVEVALADFDAFNDALLAREVGEASVDERSAS